MPLAAYRMLSRSFLGGGCRVKRVSLPHFDLGISLTPLSDPLPP